MTGAVLAAGAGRRMGQPKAGLVINGERLVDIAVSALLGGGCQDPIVIGRLGLEVPRARVVVNEDPDRGMRSSLSLAVANAGSNPAGLAILLVDTPGISAEHVAAVVNAWSPGRIAVGTHNGRRSHPVVMSLEFWRTALDEAGPDEGAKEFLSSHHALVDEVALRGDATDLDTPEDLRLWSDRHMR